MARITNSIRHTHKYYRMKSTGLWYCAGIDGCTHYMPKNMPPPTGRMSLCWSCNKEFRLLPGNMQDDQPKCDECRNELDNIGKWLDSKGLNEPKTGLEAFGAKPKVASIVAPIVKDEIEVIEGDEEHAPWCTFAEDGECICR